MATGLPTIDVNSVGGVKSLQDLYNMLAGSSETTSGGTKIETTNEGISQEGMNEMLKSALANTNGLAAISSGQRVAGGYGSSVNTMLTNDLLTRTASQIAQNNKTTTKVTSAAPVTTVKGGITAEGAKKSIGFVAGLQGLQELDKLTGFSKKIKDYMGTSESVDATAPTFSGVSTNSVGYSPAADSQAAYVDMGSNSAGGADVSSSVDSFDFSGGDSFDFGSAAMDEAATAANNTDYSGGMTDEMMWPEAFADGGEVSTNNLRQQKSNILGTNQFNRVVDSRAGKIGGGAGSNPDQVAAPAQSVGSNTNTSSQGSETGGGNSASSYRGPSEDSSGGDSLGKFVNSLATKDGQTFAKVIGTLGKLSQSPDLMKAGIIANVATSKNPAATGDAMTGGGLSKVLNVANTLKKPTVANVTDTALSFNPMTAGVNGVLKMLGFRTIGDTAGDTVNNVELRSSERNHMSPEQQQAAKDWAQSQGQQVTENPDVITTPVEGPGTIETTDLPPMDEGPMPGSDEYENNNGGGSSSNYRAPTYGDRGPGGSSGDTAASEGGATAAGPGGYATGGEISGPGTGTSDSIPARLSDGETVITAKTTQKAKEMFGEDFFLRLEAEFNAPAAARQMTKGRA